MREIKFRGLDKYGNWVYGLPYRAHGSGDFFISHSNGWVPSYSNPDEGESTELTKVDEKTVGQFSTITCKNGEDLYSGDVVKIPDDSDVFGQQAGEMYQIYFNAGGFRLKPKFSARSRGFWLEDDGELELVGNIHQNPELEVYT